MAVHLLERSQRVEAPVQRVFDFYADAANLEPLTPPWIHFKLLSPQPLHFAPGTLLEYTLRLHGVPFRWQTLIESWDPPTGFTDSQAEGPYAHWHHTHRFEAVGESATVIYDEVRYSIPYGPLGALAHVAFVRRDLRRIFDFRAAAVAARLG